MPQKVDTKDEELRLAEVLIEKLDKSGLDFEPEIVGIPGCYNYKVHSTCGKCSVAESHHNGEISYNALLFVKDHCWTGSGSLPLEAIEKARSHCIKYLKESTFLIDMDVVPKGLREAFIQYILDSDPCSLTSEKEAEEYIETLIRG